MVLVVFALDIDVLHGSDYRDMSRELSANHHETGTAIDWMRAFCPTPPEWRYLRNRCGARFP